MPLIKTTRWSLIISANESPEHTARCLAELCETYWNPVYIYIRRRGHSQEDAADLTQEFFALFIQKRFLEDVDPSKGRFRSFLLANVNHFLANERDRAQAAKRGGGILFVPLDEIHRAESRALAASSTLPPEKLFDRDWALALLEAALRRLEEEQHSAGKSESFRVLKRTLTGAEDQIPYRELAQQIDLSENAVKVAVHRLRRRYGDLIREEVMNTVSTEEDLADELRYLLEVIVA